MAKELDIFYSPDWVDIDRILLLDNFADDFVFMPSGINRIVRRTFIGYRVFVDGKYVISYSIVDDYPRYVEEKHMSYAMYFNVIVKIAKARKVQIKDIMHMFRYRSNYE